VYAVKERSHKPHVVIEQLPHLGLLKQPCVGLDLDPEGGVSIDDNSQYGVTGTDALIVG
jgi:hypothetical protein